LGSTRLPEPMCSTNGTRASERVRQIGSKSSWPGDASPAGLDGIQKAPIPSLSPSSHLGERAGRIDERHLADADQPLVLAAEMRHRAVVGANAAIEQVGVGGAEILGAGEGGEHQLAAEAQVVERPLAFGDVEGAVGGPALGPGDDIVVDGRRALRIGDARLGLADEVQGGVAGGAQRQRRQAVADLGSANRVTQSVVSMMWLSASQQTRPA
jgi:hypothetical protein